MCGKPALAPSVMSRQPSSTLAVRSTTSAAAHRKVTPFSNSGRPLVVRIAYHAHEPVRNPTFALKFHSDAGAMVTAPNSRRARFEAGTVSGEGAVLYKIPRMHLTPGTYHVTVGVYDENNLHVYDQREREFELKVQPGAAPDTEGYLDIGGEWVLPGRSAGNDGEA